MTTMGRLVVAFALLSPGCTIVSANTQHTNTENGVWYVKRPLVGDAEVFYCPPADRKCYRAEIRGDVEGSDKWQLEGISRTPGEGPGAEDRG